MAQTPEWAPMVGLRFPGSVLIPGSEEAVALAAAMEVVRRRICQYSDGTRDVRCDCKFGLGAQLTEGASISRHGERTGCPELRVAITALLTAPELPVPSQRITDCTSSEKAARMLADPGLYFDQVIAERADG